MLYILGNASSEGSTKLEQQAKKSSAFSDLDDWLVLKSTPSLLVIMLYISFSS